MFFLYLECAQGRLGAWEGGRAPSPGSLGCLPRGGSRAQTTRPTFSRRPCKFASNLLSILMLMFCPFGLDLGPLLCHVGVIGMHFCDPSWSRNRLRTVSSAKKSFFTKHHVFVWFWAEIGPKMGSRSNQDRPRTGQRSSLIACFASSFFASMFDRFGVGFGAVLGSQMVPGEGG